MRYPKLIYYYLLSIAVIVIDQVVKLVVHFNMYPGEEIPLLGDFFKIHYITNPGMAFGIEFGGEYGKIGLSVFRLVAMFAIAWYMSELYKKKSPHGLLICIALIFGGAIGNLVDSIFYGKLLHLTVEGAPTPWFHGEVVDMFYLDIAKGFYPDWIPFFGGDYYSFWPIFNIADAAIFIAVCVLLVFQKRYFKEDDSTQADTSAAVTE